MVNVEAHATYTLSDGKADSNIYSRHANHSSSASATTAAARTSVHSNNQSLSARLDISVLWAFQNTGSGFADTTCNTTYSIFVVLYAMTVYYSNG